MCEKIVCANKNLNQKTHLNAQINLNTPKNNFWKTTPIINTEILLAKNLGFKKVFFKSHNLLNAPKFNELINFAKKQNFEHLEFILSTNSDYKTKLPTQSTIDNLTKITFVLDTTPATNFLTSLKTLNFSKTNLEFEITITNNNINNLQEITTVLTKLNAKIIFRPLNPTPFIENLVDINLGITVISKGNLVPILSQVATKLKPIMEKDLSKNVVKIFQILSSSIMH